MVISVSSPNLLLLLMISSLDWLPSPGSAFLIDQNHMTSSAPFEPHFTECISREQVTFSCWWSPGTFHNLSAPGALKVFYLKKERISPSEWKECPEYNHSNRECFFDANHTMIWVPYCMQLRSENNITYFNEDDCFTVENIVRPDPPVSLNWTLLNISPSGLSYDVTVSWEPPPSADVGVGWMRLEYEIQYRERNSTNWEALEMQPHTQQTIYGLHTGKEYEVHIHCRMQGFIKFGKFSDPIFIQVTEIPSKESTVPVTLVLIFGIVGILILIMLIAISQQHRLMLVLLPPVPAPKIKGIDSEMLKKGKLQELNFMLNGGNGGGLPTYTTNFYQDEPWVEFIEVDEEDADTAEKEDNQGSDTQRLLGLPQPVSHIILGCSNTISQPDDDSGRASCFDADVSEQDTQMLIATLLPGQLEDEEVSLDFAESTPALERGETPLVQTQTEGPQTWVNTDFYAQVSNVMPSGGVVLSPGQQHRIQENTSASEKEIQKKGKQNEDNEGQKEEEPQFQLLVLDPEGSGYTTESNIQQISTPPSSPMPGEGYQIIQPQPMETKPVATKNANQSPYILPDSPQSQLFPPVADYTVVQELDTHHSLLLNPPPHQSPPPCLPQHPLKSPMPVGYITPDLLGNLSP
ncbi:growth hormone receptor a [Melanotaenia boesemani]|uniref:growth hormone receptor a n=1 Tax=Melanotaenia boesemani TaxID=1250792 RepID=UPI001C05A9F6|nr:growth hormone receptor a [Melanotaenia boesemani]